MFSMPQQVLQQSVRYVFICSIVQTNEIKSSRQQESRRANDTTVSAVVIDLNKIH